MLTSNCLVLGGCVEVRRKMKIDKQVEVSLRKVHYCMNISLSFYQFGTQISGKNLKRKYILPALVSIFANHNKPEKGFHFYKKAKKWKEHSACVLQQAIIEAARSQATKVIPPSSFLLNDI